MELKDLEIGKIYNVYIHPMSGKLGQLSHKRISTIKVIKKVKKGFLCVGEMGKNIVCNNRDFIKISENPINL